MTATVHPPGLPSAPARNGGSGRFMDPLRFRKLVREVVSAPTAPFHEAAPMAVLRCWVATTGSPHVTLREDHHGNLFVRYTPPNPVARLGILTHTDHPGFHIRAVSPPDADGTVHLDAEWLGGVDASYFLAAGGAAVRVFHSVGNDERGIPQYAEFVGRVTATSPSADQPPLPGFASAPKRFERVKRATLSLPRGTILADGPRPSPGDFAMWDWPGFAEGDGSARGIVHGRALDDLIGCAINLATLLTLAEEEAPVELWSVFTRAEEIGFVGTLALLQSEELPAGLPMLVIESSKALPGAEIGQGPVIRLGDRMGIFDFGMVQHMRECADNLVAARTAPANGSISTADAPSSVPPFRFQQKLMDGGTCEATPLMLHGFPTAGVSIPLGNYHNMSFTPQDPAIRPEYVHADDLDNGLKLVTETARRMTSSPGALGRFREQLHAKAADDIRRLAER